MTHRHYLVGILIASLMGWASWLLVVNNLNPFVSGYLALTLFYSSLFVALAGTFGILNYYLRLMLSNTGKAISHINTGLRQGGLLSLLVVIGLIFQRERVLTWWVALLLLVIMALIEYYFMHKE